MISLRLFALGAAGAVNGVEIRPFFGFRGDLFLLRGNLRGSCLETPIGSPRAKFRISRLAPMSGPRRNPDFTTDPRASWSPLDPTLMISCIVTGFLLAFVYGLLVAFSILLTGTRTKT